MWIGLLLFIVSPSFGQLNETIVPSQGMLISESITFKPGIYYFQCNDSSDLTKPYITITGVGVTVDFNGAVFRGLMHSQSPNTFEGVGIRVEGGEDITIKNVAVHGFGRAMEVVGVKHFTLTNADLSWNYREPVVDCSFYQSVNANKEWFTLHRRAENMSKAALYLENCVSPEVKYVYITGGQDGMHFNKCVGTLAYNNTIQYNSGFAIMLQQSVNNRIVFNRLDWNFGQNNEGHLSGGIAFSESSVGNEVIKNSITNCQLGLLISSAGRGTNAEVQEAGVISANDFSFAGYSGIEVHTGKWQITDNQFKDGVYGVRAHQSTQLELFGNHFSDNKAAIDLEGAGNWLIKGNLIEVCSVGVKAGRPEKREQRTDKAEKSTLSLYGNLFKWVDWPLQTYSVDTVRVTGGNQFFRFKELWVGDQIGSEVFADNFIHQNLYWGKANAYRNKNSFSFNSTSLKWNKPEPVSDFLSDLPADGILVAMPESHPTGSVYQLSEEWGPYNFQYPKALLTRTKDSIYQITLLGPPGEWQVIEQEGWRFISDTFGYTPGILEAKPFDSNQMHHLRFSYKGSGFLDQFGHMVSKDSTYLFQFRESLTEMNWLIKSTNLADKGQLVPSFDLPAAENNRFVSDTVAVAFSKPVNLAGKIPKGGESLFMEGTSVFNFPQGRYKTLISCSGEGKLFLDGQLVFDSAAIEKNADSSPYIHQFQFFASGREQQFSFTYRPSERHSCFLFLIAPL